MKKFIHYRHYEVDRKKYETGVKVLDNYTWATDNMDEPVNCICCEKKLTYGECYTSRRWYSSNGLWGLWVCPECYSQEWEEKREYDKKMKEEEEKEND